MEKDKAAAILAKHLEPYRAKPYDTLKNMIGQVDAYEASTPDDLTYQIKIEAFWDDKPNGDIRVTGAIDDGGWRAFFPLTDGFIVSPDGTFVGE